MEHKLDLKDRKILYELDKDSRQSFGSIAKKVGLSKNSVITRVNHLKEIGVIKSFNTIVDLGKIGFMQFRFYFDLKNLNQKKEQEIIEFLCSKKIVTQVDSMDGIYNLGALIITRDIVEMHELWDDLFDMYVNYIEKRLLTIVTRNFYYYRPYISGLKRNNGELEITTKQGKEKIEEINIKLLKILAKNARAPVIEIADELKITPKTVITHIRDLEKKKLIVGYTTSLDLEKAGYQIFRVSFILFRLTKQTIQDFQEYAMSHPNIVYDEEVVGGDDYELEIHVTDIKELREIIKEIQSKFTDIIQDYKILHLYKQHKSITFPEKI